MGSSEKMGHSNSPSIHCSTRCPSFSFSSSWLLDVSQLSNHAATVSKTTRVIYLNQTLFESGAEYAVDATEGCAAVYTTVPGPFLVLHIDKTDYEYDGENHCLNTCNSNDVIECSFIERK
nr:hypothetical transcript [Hymenolepis microstoma]